MCRHLRRRTHRSPTLLAKRTTGHARRSTSHPQPHRSVAVRHLLGQCAYQATLCARDLSYMFERYCTGPLTVIESWEDTLIVKAAFLRSMLAAVSLRLVTYNA